MSEVQFLVQVPDRRLQGLRGCQALGQQSSSRRLLQGMGVVINPFLKRAEPFASRRGTIVNMRDLDLAIDPGKHTGWALFYEVLLGCGVGEPPFEQARRVVIELPQNYPSNPVPPQ